MSSGGVSLTPHVPSLVAQTTHAAEYVYFPQTMRWAGESLFISYQNDSDALHDDGWTGGLLGSNDTGSSWVRLAQPLSPNLVKSCFATPSPPGTNSTTCLEYATRKLSPNSSVATSATLGLHVYTAVPSGVPGASGPVVQSSVRQARITFPEAHEPSSWGTNTFKMVSDGKVLPLPGTSDLLMLLYGTYAGDTSYSIVATKSSDGGATWEWLSTVSHGAPSPCNSPSEHDCTFLESGSIYCVWRSDGGTLCSSQSADHGATWTDAVPLSADVPPPARPPVTRECQAVLDAFCSNTSAAANGACIEATEKAYSDTLPMYGLFDVGCAKPELSGPCVGPDTAPAAWRCYSHLSVVDDPTSNSSHRWSNDTAHPNAMCSQSGAALSKLYAECMPTDSCVACPGRCANLQIYPR